MRVSSEVEVALARLDAPPEAVRALAATLCESERSRAKRFHFERDRRRYIVARARLRELLAARLATEPSRIELVYGPNGKPELAPRLAQTGWRFNVSHCDEVAVYAFSRGARIGIDLEALRAQREADAIAARFFSPRENEAYRGLAARDKPLGFIHCWTRKEAFVKALGDGLRAPRSKFEVSLAPGELPAVLSIAGVRGDGGWRLESFAPCPGFIAALAMAPG